MFEVEYLCDGRAKKDGVNANLVLCDWPNFRHPNDFAFSPRLNNICCLNTFMPTKRNKLHCSW